MQLTMLTGTLAALRKIPDSVLDNKLRNATQNVVLHIYKQGIYQFCLGFQFCLASNNSYFIAGSSWSDLWFSFALVSDRH